MARPRTVIQLPPGYQEHHFLSLTAGRRLLWLNLAAIGLLVPLIAWFFGWLLFYHRVVGAPLVIDSLPDDLNGLVVLALVFLMLPAHEFFHGMAMKYYGHAVRYGAKPKKLVIYATSDNALFWRNQYVAIALSPLIAISVLMMISSLVVPLGISFWLMWIGVLNGIGAIGDLWMVYVARRYSSDALFRDEEDGMRIFVQEVQC